MVTVTLGRCSCTYSPTTQRPRTACAPAILPRGFSPKRAKQTHFRLRSSFRLGSLQRFSPDTEVPRLNSEVDDRLSSRPLQLDPAGYFIIKLDRTSQELVAEYFTNTINKAGLACDPETGEVIPCTPGYRRPPTHIFKARTAKELSVLILEQQAGGAPCTRLEHANYLGREFQRAEMALVSGDEYVQD